MKKLSIGGVARKAIPAGKNAAWATGGAILVLVVSVAAQQAAAPTPEECALRDAASEALNSRVKMIGMTTPDPSKYFSPGGADSCLGPFSDLDLSIMIPDPFGLLTDAAMAVVDAVAKAAVNKVCTAVRNQFSSVVDRYNDVLGTTKGFGDIKGMIDGQIGKQVDASLGEYGVKYNAPAASNNNPLAQYKVTNNATGLNNVATGATTLLQNSAANTAAMTSAAGQMEIQRLNLAREQAAAQASANAAASEQQRAAAAERVRAAEASYNAAQKSYQDAAKQVNTPTGQAAPVQPATIGSSVF